MADREEGTAAPNQRQGQNQQQQNQDAVGQQHLHINWSNVKPEFSGKPEEEDSMEIIDLDKTIETTIFEGTLEDMEDRIIEENIEIIGTMNITEVGIGQEKGHSQGIMVTIVTVAVDQGQDLKLALTEIG